MGTCGIAAGARETMQAIQQELAKRQIQAHVGTVGCIGMCAKEPLVDIQQAGKSHILYANIAAGDGAAADRGAPGEGRAGQGMGDLPDARRVKRAR